MGIKLKRTSFAAVGKMISVMLMFLGVFAGEGRVYGQTPQPMGNNYKHTLHNGGGRPDAENVVILITGDAYTSSSADQTKFLQMAQKVSEVILDKYPFSLFKDRTNIYAVEIHSASSSNGYFGLVSGGSFAYRGGPVKGDSLAAVMKRHAPKADVMIIYANHSSQSGGSVMGWTGGGERMRGYLATGSTDKAPITTQHELGHAFGGLWDEYCNNNLVNMDVSGYANVTKDSNPANAKWKAWLGIENIGMNRSWNDQSCPGWYWPTFFISNTDNSKGICMMNGAADGKPYCRVCTSELIRLLAERSSKETYQAKSDITEANIPAGAVRVLEGAFHGCYKLKTVNIASSVSSIGEYAFLRCTTLTTITNNAKTPQPINSTVFYDVKTSKVTLRVPDGSVAAYSAADVWKDFKIVSFSGDESYEPELPEPPVPPVPTTVKITFNSKGGSEVAEETINAGTAYTPSAVPTQSGFTFAGWYTNSATTTKWVDGTSVDKDITLYAKWIKDNTALSRAKSFDGKHGIIVVKNPVVGGFAEFVVKTPEKWVDVKLTIYDNLGNAVFSNERRLTISDNKMKWDLRNANGRAVAAGSYLAVVECKGANGIYRYYTKFGVLKSCCL